MYYDYFAKHKNTKLGERMVWKMFDTLSNWISELAPGRKRILEIGIGRAVFATSLKNVLGDNLEYVGIEPNDDLRGKAESMGFKTINAILPPFPIELQKASFDVVIISHVLEHFKNHSEVLEVLQCVNDLLKPGGHFVLVYPDYNDWGSEFFDIDYSHSYPITERRVNHLLTDTGFSLVKSVFFRAHFYRCHFITSVMASIVDAACLFGRLFIKSEVIYKAKITLRRNGLAIAKKL